MNSSARQTDVLIIGAGAAGLSLALRLADRANVLLLGKGRLTESSSRYAQGGVAAVLSGNDSIAAHVEDTLGAGDGLCDEETVRFVVERGKENIRWLINQGVDFTRRNKPPTGDSFTEYHLTREGGHGKRRVIHAADTTGQAIVETLEQKVRLHPRVTLLDYHIALDLITATDPDGKHRCVGAYIFNRKHKRVEAISARAVALASGGASKVYLYTSNPDTSTGDGIAMAWRAGCRVGNMEFVQFHPTCLYHPEAGSFLISEALRGEGGKLKLPNGQPFMSRYDKRAELAPRDIVARAIDSEMKLHGLDHVLLDISHLAANFILQHFPAIAARCESYGYDITTMPIPVVPAAHYLCGGIVTDLQGRTDVNALYALGECSYTGFHGANRLASNSLLECLVFAQSAADQIALQLQQSEPEQLEIPAWDESRVTDSDEEVVVAHNWDELRRFMWDFVGIVRTDKRLARAARRIALLKQEINDYYGNFRVSNDLIELRNLVMVAELIVESAMLRKESRGLHYSLDHPEKSSQAEPTILTPAASEPTISFSKAQDKVSADSGPLTRFNAAQSDP